MERRALPRFRFHPDASAVAVHDSLANGQTDARARILLAAVQTLEDEEDAFLVFGVDADAVVAHGEVPEVFLAADVDVDS